MKTTGGATILTQQFMVKYRACTISKLYLNEINQRIIDVRPVWKEKATARAQLVEEKQFLFLKETHDIRIN